MNKRRFVGCNGWDARSALVRVGLVGKSSFLESAARHQLVFQRKSNWLHPNTAYAYRLDGAICTAATFRCLVTSANDWLGSSRTANSL
jgi:hypothetical protein